MADKVVITMPVAVHPIKAALWRMRHKIRPEMSLREIGTLIGVDSAQQVKHHLQTMVAMGAINYIGGQYVFFKNHKTR